jgi:hypothetical protein
MVVIVPEADGLGDSDTIGFWVASISAVGTSFEEVGVSLVLAGVEVGGDNTALVKTARLNAA